MTGFERRINVFNKKGESENIFYAQQLPTGHINDNSINWSISHVRRVFFFVLLKKSSNTKETIPPKFFGITYETRTIEHILYISLTKKKFRVNIQEGYFVFHVIVQ